jgi:hypothetical protein
VLDRLANRSIVTSRFKGDTVVDGTGTAGLRIEVGVRDRVIVAVVFSRPPPARNG